MNNKWQNEINLKKLGGWSMIPNMLFHNFKQLGLNSQMVCFICDVISNSDDWKIFDNNMTDHGTSKTLREIRRKLTTMGYLTYKRWDERATDGRILSSGFIYDFSGLLDKITELAEEQKEDSEEQKCASPSSFLPSAVSKVSPTNKYNLINNKSNKSTTKQNLVVEKLDDPKVVGTVVPLREGEALKRRAGSPSATAALRASSKPYTLELEAVQNKVVDNWNKQSFPKVRSCDVNPLFHFDDQTALEEFNSNIPLLKYYNDEYWLESNKNLAFALHRIYEFNTFCKNFMFIDHIWERFIKDNPIKLNEDNFESRSTYKEAVVKLYKENYDNR